MNKYITPALIGLTLVSGMFLYSRTINFGTVQYEVVAAPSSTPSPLSTPSPQPTTSPSVAPSVTPTSAPAKPTSSPTPETPVNVGVEENSTNKVQDKTPAPKPKVVIPGQKLDTSYNIQEKYDCNSLFITTGGGSAIMPTYEQFRSYIELLNKNIDDPNLCGYYETKARLGKLWDEYEKMYNEQAKVTKPNDKHNL